MSAVEYSVAARAVHRVANKLERLLHPEGLTVFQSNRSAGWQDVMHLHFHVVPRFADDSLMRPWTVSAGSAHDLATLTESLREPG